MPTYGPWIQAPDFIKDGTAAGVEPATPTDTLVSQTYSSHDPPTPGQVQELQLAAITTDPVNGLGEPIGPAGVGGRMRYEIDQLGTVLSPPISTVLKATIDFRPRSVSANNFGICNWAPILLGTPAGAIGWQWQSDMAEGTVKRSDVVSCVLNVHVPSSQTIQYNADDSASVDPQPVVGDFQVGLWAAPGSFSSTGSTDPWGVEPDLLTQWPGPLAGTLLAATAGPAAAQSFSVDITDLLDSEGRVCVYERNMFGDIDSGAPSPAVPRVLGADERGLAYGPPHFLDTIEDSGIEWTFRPPVFRWIYETPPVAPPCRRYPRHDDLGNSPRIYPPPPTRQRSGRISGYY